MDGKRKFREERVVGIFLAYGFCEGNSVCSVSNVVDRFKKPSPPDVLPACTRRPVWAWPGLNQGAKCKIQNIFPIPPATCTWRTTEFAQRLSLVFKTDLKLSPGRHVAVPERQLLMQLEIFPAKGRCMEKAEHKRQNMPSEQSAVTVMNTCLKSRL